MEDALDGVKSYLTSNLEAALVVIESARSCTVTRWKVLDIYVTQSRQIPAILILPEGSIPEYGDEEGPFNDAWYTHVITIATICAGSKPKEVMYELMRYQEAYRALIATDYTFGSLFNRVRLGASEYGEAIAAQEEKKLALILEQEIAVREVL